MNARLLGLLGWFGLVLSSGAWGYGVPNNAGLRSAERESPTKITLIFGPAIRVADLAKKVRVFQVASPSDKDFQTGVSAARVKMVKKEADGTYPEGWGGPRFTRYRLEVTLPEDHPMKDGPRYWIRVNSHGVAGLNKRAKWITGKGQTPAQDLKPRYGIRELYWLSPHALHLITGAGLDTKRLKKPGLITVRSADDPDFKGGAVPLRIHRRGNLDFYIPDGWPWYYRQRHELFLVFEQTFKNGKTYTLELNSKPGQPLTCGVSKASLTCDDRETLNLAIKVNQYGYLPEAREKYAYLGIWMGDGNAYDFGPFAKRFEVRDAKTHEVVLKGKPTLRRKATYRLVNGKCTPDPKKVKGPETVYKKDLSYEDVYQLDLSKLKKEGRYYVALPGMGRSFSFRVARDVYLKPFQVLMNGLYHQRSGIELKAPWTRHYRPAGHRNKTEYAAMRGGGLDSNAWKELPKHATDGQKHDLWGGHHDAGDWNPRSHLDVAEKLFLLYEINPEAFSDGQLKIPESRNGLPDVLDEAHWALDLWTRLQDADGGVHHGIESNGDPKEGDTPATDRLREFAFAKDAIASYRFAAVAAQASILWKKNGQDAPAGDFLKRARQAWDWARKHPEPVKKYKQKESDQLVFAAAMLLRATGEARFNAAFKKHSIYSARPSAPPWKYSKYDQLHGSFYYALAAQADPKLKSSIVAAFEVFFKSWLGPAQTTTYRYMRSPYAPNTWGTGGLPVWTWIPAMTMHLTQNPALKARARQWILFTNDFSLGCDPLNLVFTVGLGQRYVHGAFHLLQLNSPEGLIPGLQSEGPGGRWIAGQNPGRGGMGKWPGMSMYPPGPWPDLYKYSDNASPGMSEGVVANQVKTALSYGLFVPPAGK